MEFEDKWNDTRLSFKNKVVKKRMKSSLNLTKILQNAAVQEQECTKQEKEHW